MNAAPAPAAHPSAASPSQPAPVPPALAIERLTVRTGRIVCDVVLSPACPRLTTPELAARVRAQFPTLPRHACVNDRGPTFAAVMESTPLPHLLEHLVIDLQTRASCHPDHAAQYLPGCHPERSERSERSRGIPRGVSGKAPSGEPSGWHHTGSLDSALRAPLGMTTRNSLCAPLGMTTGDSLRAPLGMTNVPPPDFAFVGTTEWTDEKAGRARIEVNFTDDLVGLRAFRDAADYLNGIVVT